MKLGKLPPLHDPRTLKLARYLQTPELPFPPQEVDYGAKQTDWPMALNDQLGCCTVATAVHMIHGWTEAAQGGPGVLIPDSEVVRVYSAISGYIPGRPETDNGAYVLNLLKYWKNQGIGGHRIAGFVAFNHRDVIQARAAVWLFGGAYLGVALPKTAQGKKLWAVEDPALVGPAAPGSWGGHATHVDGYTGEYLFDITWAERIRMSWAFWFDYVDEAYAILSEDWIDKITKKAPSGFDYAQLAQDLVAVAQ